MFFKIINTDLLKIEHAYEADDAVKYGGQWGSFPHVAVPEGVDPECVRATSWVEDVTVEDEPARTIPAVTHVDEATGEVVEDVPAQEIPAVTHVEQVTRYGLELDPDLVAAKVLRVKQERIGAAYLRMDEDILARCLQIYGSGTALAALTWEIQWLRMSQNPASFVGYLGLEDEAAVLAYVQTKVTERSIPAGQYRLERIAQFLAERDAILAE